MEKVLPPPVGGTPPCLPNGFGDCFAHGTTVHILFYPLPGGSFLCFMTSLLHHWKLTEAGRRQIMVFLFKSEVTETWGSSFRGKRRLHISQRSWKVIKTQWLHRTSSVSFWEVWVEMWGRGKWKEFWWPVGKAVAENGHCSANLLLSPPACTAKLDFPAFLMAWYGHVTDWPMECGQKQYPPLLVLMHKNLPWSLLLFLSLPASWVAKSWATLEATCWK